MNCSERAAGFSLLELLIVIAIISLLVSYVGPKLFTQIGKGERATAHAQIDAFGKAIAAYRIDNGNFPPAGAGLKALMEKPVNAKRWNGPYLDKALPEDPWGNAYVYRFPGKNGDYDLLSLGRDGQTGGSDEDADITNW